MALTRRQLLTEGGIIALAAAFPFAFYFNAKSRWPEKPSVPTDFNAEEFFCELAENGTGFLIGNPNAELQVGIVFDPQCRWCMWLYNEITRYASWVGFRWYPIAVLNPWSELQGAMIISAADPIQAFREHEAHFKDEFRGLDVRGKEIPWDARLKVWNNSRIARRAGTRVVPFAVLRTKDFRYIPFPKIEAKEFEKLAGF